MLIVTFVGCSTTVHFNATVDGEPIEGAKVYVDGQLIGETPTTAKLSNAVWEDPDIKITADGYRQLNTGLKKEIIGTWENEHRFIQFTDKEFVILNRNIMDESEFVGFSGTYKFSKDPKNAIKMKYQYAIGNDGCLIDLSGTDYEEYMDIISLHIINDKMQMYVAKNGKAYTYTRANF